MAAVARIAAALVAVTLTGAPRVLALHAPPEAHRCTCRAHGSEACECASCHQAALKAEAMDERVPPCHRAAAQHALSAAGERSSRGEPCVEGSCGSTSRPAVTIAAVEPFHRSVSPPLPLRVPERPLPGLLAPLLDRPLEPETPPPKPA